MTPALTQSELFALLTAGQTVVLPQAYAAALLRARFRADPHTGSPGLDPGPLVAWHEWTANLWSVLTIEGHEDRLLLNHVQEHQLWVDIIAAHPNSRDLPPQAPEELATLARSALRLAASYNIVERLRHAADTPDTHVFSGWLDAFRDHCHRHRLLPPALLDQALQGHVRGGALRLPNPTHFAGLDEETPSQRDLLTSLRSAGAQVHIYALREPQRAGHRVAFVAPNPAEELRLAVRLIAHQARQGEGKTPTFAIVLPKPEDRRLQLERLFREILAPELEPITADISSAPWHFATQPPLPSATCVAHALDLLRWLREPLPTARIGPLLLSPYFGFAESLEHRARFEARALRSYRLLQPEFTLASFVRLVTESSRPQARFPELQSLGRQIERDKLLGGARTQAEWADRVRALLRAVSWPGTRILTPSEFAATEAWDSLLDQLSTLSATARRVSFATFLQQLEREAQSAAVPDLNPGAPVQVLSLSQAEGTNFDLTLVLEATDSNLPTPERLHPLLPRHLQTTFGMPGADPSLTYTRCRARIQHLAARSGTLYLTAPAADETGSRRLTPIAREVNCSLLAAEDVLPPEPAPQPISLEVLPDTDPLPSLPPGRTEGGARILELQAACGFRAFASFRLRAEELSTVTLGLDPRQAGTLLHKCMELLWSDLKSQANLRALSSLQRKAAVRGAVGSALESFQSTADPATPWAGSFLRILEERYSRLLLRWVEFELERTPFSVLATEQDRTLTIGPLQLSVRLDRLDQVEGGQVLVDYKTAYTLNAQQWLGPRPDSPQLPLYALLNEPEELRGIAFARVRWDKTMGWIGLSDDAKLFGKTSRNPTQDLAAQREEWRVELTALAEAFARGETGVDPKSYPKTCEFCVHRLLCRLDPASLLAEVAEEELSEEELNG